MLQRISLLTENINCQIRISHQIRITDAEQQIHKHILYQSELDYRQKQDTLREIQI